MFSAGALGESLLWGWLLLHASNTENRKEWLQRQITVWIRLYWWGRGYFSVNLMYLRPAEWEVVCLNSWGWWTVRERRIPGLSVVFLDLLQSLFKMLTPGAHQRSESYSCGVRTKNLHFNKNNRGDSEIKVIKHWLNVIFKEKNLLGAHKCFWILKKNHLIPQGSFLIVKVLKASGRDFHYRPKETRALPCC